MKQIKIIELRKKGFKTIPFEIIDGNNGTVLYVVDDIHRETDARISSTEVKHITYTKNKDKLKELLENHSCVEIGRYIKGGKSKSRRFKSAGLFIRKP